MSAQDASPGLLEAIGHTFRPTTTVYSKKDAALYALAIGASSDPLAAEDLTFTYELNGSGFSPFPTFATTFPIQTLGQIADIPGQQLNLMDIVHGEHYLELQAPLPPSATIQNQARISQIYDKGSGALIVAEVTSKEQGGQTLAVNRASIFVRGRGNFGGERGPSSKMDSAPSREPDRTVLDRTRPDQALLFRLASGDMNPLHVDTRFALLLGFKKPILHGLCTYGFAARAVLGAYAGSDPGRLRSIKARFSHHIFPGETIETAIWQASATRLLFQSRVVERGEVILSNGLVTLNAA